MEAIVQITNPTGLHARPAAQFVQQAAKFKSKVVIEGNGKSADAKSILGVMSLGVTKNTDLKISATGEAEAACVQALVELVESRFGEE